MVQIAHNIERRKHEEKEIFAKPKVQTDTATILTYCAKTNLETSEETCGKPFSIDWLPYLREFGLSDQQTSIRTEQEDKESMKLEPQFVTAFSDNHFSAAQSTLFPTFKLYHPDRKIVVYDLGMKPLQLKKVSILKFWNFGNVSIFSCKKTVRFPRSVNLIFRNIPLM